MNESTNCAQGSGIGRRALLGALGATALGAAAGPVLGSSAAAAAPLTPPGKGKAVRTGAQELIASDYELLRGQKVGNILHFEEGVVAGNKFYPKGGEKSEALPDVGGGERGPGGVDQQPR